VKDWKRKKTLTQLTIIFNFTSQSFSNSPLPLIRTFSRLIPRRSKKHDTLPHCHGWKIAMNANRTITMCGGCAERRALEDASARRSLLSRLAAETTERAALAERVAALSRECVEAQAAAEEEGRARRAAETRAAAVGGRGFFVFLGFFFNISHWWFFCIFGVRLFFIPRFLCVWSLLSRTLLFFFIENKYIKSLLASVAIYRVVGGCW
jgi:hypothetical protein